jgi:hypothetical protein
MKWARHAARIRKMRNAYRILMGKARRKETTGKTET